jgi:chromosome segregation ATPase
MDETGAHLSGRLFGIQKLVDASSTVLQVLGDKMKIQLKALDKVPDVLDHISDVMGELQTALQAYSLMKMLEHKFESDPEVMQLKKQVALVELRHKRSDLDRTRTKLERKIKELQVQKEKLERRSPGVNHALKDGTTQVNGSKPSQMSREKKPLTHRIDLTSAVEGLKDAAVEPPAAEAVASP